MESNFNDERINFEISKAKYYSIIFSLIFSFIYIFNFIISRVIMNNDIHVSILDFSVDAQNFSEMGFAILLFLYSFIVVVIDIIQAIVNKKDELYYYKKSKFYHLTFRILIVLCLIFNAILIPMFIRFQRPFSVISLTSLIFFISFITILIYLRKKQIYFNYQIIENNNRTYYKQVAKNISKIALLFFLLQSISLVIGLIIVLKNNLGLNLGLFILVRIVLLYIVLSSILILYYFVISVFEKSIYNKNNDIGISLITVIIISLCLFIQTIFDYRLLIMNDALNYLYNLLSVNGETLGEFVARIALMYSYISILEFILSFIGFIYLYFDLKSCNSKEKVKKLLKILFIIFVVHNYIQCYRVFCNIEVSYCINLLIVKYDYTQFVSTYNDIQSIIGIIYNLIISVFVLIIGLNLNKSKSKVYLILVSILSFLVCISQPINEHGILYLTIIFRVPYIILIINLLLINLKRNNIEINSVKEIDLN